MNNNLQVIMIILKI